MTTWVNEWVPQIFIGIFGLAAIFLISTKGKWQRWGHVCGLIGQPFWYWTTIYNEQWLLLGLSIIYTFSWINGFRNHFLTKEST